MVIHISARLAWHDNGWNGHICTHPADNVYCIGQHSYPGDMIRESRNLEWEDSVAGLPCHELGDMPPCINSINAFGRESIDAYSDPPEWLDPGNAQRKHFELPPSTVCTWPYEPMYSDEVKAAASSGRQYNYDKRLELAKEYFDKLEPHKTLIFYYANYSNPFSEGERKRYVLVGMSRLKSVGEIMYYDGLSERTRKRYAGGFVWQMPVTSHYPDEGLRIPYHVYDDPDVLDRMLFVPDNPRSFKYGSREISDDGALDLVEKSLEIVDYLIQYGDESEDWQRRRSWLQQTIAELWHNRGRYPGLPQVLSYLELEEAISHVKSSAVQGEEEECKRDIFSFLNGDSDTIPGIELAPSTVKRVRRCWSVKKEAKRSLLAHTLPRFDLTEDQIDRILNNDRIEHGISVELEKIEENPYILSEQFTGDSPDDSITFSKIDHGMIPSPELGLEPAVTADAPERLRSLCVEALKHKGIHSFVSAQELMNDVNNRLDFYPEWKTHTFTERYFDVDEDFLLNELVFRHKDSRKYVYLKKVYEDERLIRDELNRLEGRSSAEIRRPLPRRWWRERLHEETEMSRKYPDEYEEAISNQVDVCATIFRKPLSVICGGAGTGKTYLLDAIVKAIKHTEGRGTSVRLLAPTGKAADRIREMDIPASTIHSFLAEHGWLRDNLTFRRSGGMKEESLSTIIIDESSMLDLGLTATLFRAVNWHSVKRLIFVGDPNQLPPIGRGKVFSDIVEWLSEVDPDAVGRLTCNFRQMENRLKGIEQGIEKIGSVFSGGELSVKEHKLDIIDTLSQIQEGGNCFDDLRVFYWDDEKELERQLLETLRHDLQSATGLDLDENELYELWNELHSDNGYERRPDCLQIISPYRGERFGTDNINTLVQRELNEHNIDRRGTLGGITLFDKVIQTRNRPRSNPYAAYNQKVGKTEDVVVYNGEIGFVKPHGFDHKKWRKRGFTLNRFQVAFGRKPEYWVPFSRGEVEDNIELAYAMSVHKAQGSDFDRVYFVLPQSKTALLSRELLYTAVTRAKEHLTIFVEKDISAFLSLMRKEKSILERINSSLFDFEPRPDALIHLGSWDYEEGKIHRTLADYMVRSKSEVIIANMLQENGITFEYETPLFADDGTFHLPDFTIVWEGRKYYWEHLGMLDRADYRKRWEKKHKWYERHFSGQLITTEESGNLSKDAEAIIDRNFSLDVSR